MAFCGEAILRGEVARISSNGWKSLRLRRAVPPLDPKLCPRMMVWPSSSGTRDGDDETIAVVKILHGEDRSLAITDAQALYDLFHKRFGAAGFCHRAQLGVAVMACGGAWYEYARGLPHEAPR